MKHCRFVDSSAWEPHGLAQCCRQSEGLLPSWAGQVTGGSIEVSGIIGAASHHNITFM